jgi:hypothetical protein
VLLGLAGLALGACGSGVERGRIFGKISSQGQPVSKGLVLFSDPSKGINMMADLKPDGSYEITTADGVGLPLGTYQVCVCPPLAVPGMGPPDTQPKPKEYANIPKKYRRYETAGLSLTVKRGENPFDIDMKP